MDNKKTLELIKSYAIGCSGKDDTELLKSLMDSDPDFPWKAVGEYQNIAALLPSSLMIELPSKDLKDNIARELFRYKEEIEAKQKLKKAREESSTLKEVSQPETEIEPVASEEQPEQLINMDETDFTQPTVQHEQEVFEKSIDDENRTTTAIDKEAIEKVTKDYIRNYFEKELRELNRSVKKSMTLTIILFTISLLAIVLVFLSLT